MNQVIRKPIIGIIGGIGAGKSSVAQAFAELGCSTIDADKIAHDLLDTPDLQKKIILLWGQDLLTPTGQINRSKLGKLVFNDPAKLDQLNQIVHPPVLLEIERLITQYQQKPEIPAIILDMPLLVEVGWAVHCDHLIFVDCDPSLRLQRIHKDGRFSLEQWEKRENYQISLDTKQQLADTTVSNNSGFSALVKQVAKIFTEVVNIES